MKFVPKIIDHRRFLEISLVSILEIGLVSILFLIRNPEYVTSQVMSPSVLFFVRVFVRDRDGVVFGDKPVYLFCVLKWEAPIDARFLNLLKICQELRKNLLSLMIDGLSGPLYVLVGLLS